MFGFGSKPAKRQIINRDPNNQINFNGLSIQGNTGLASSRMAINSSGGAAKRGAAARAALNYSKMSRIGSGAVAGQLQKNAFSKLKEAGSSEVRQNLKLYK